MKFEFSTRKIILLLGLPTTGLFLYWWFKSKQEDNDDFEEKVKTSRQSVIEVKVPPKAVGPLIGRQGANIKELQQKTKTRINFKDDTKRDDEEDRTLVIRGATEDATEAELLIRKTIAELPVVISEEIQVPTNSLGRIIGRGGESIRQISRASCAKVYIDRSQDKEKTKAVSITGTRQQIDVAKSLIQDKLNEEAEFRAKKAVMEANREQRSRSKSGPYPVKNGPNRSDSASSDGVAEHLFQKWPKVVGYAEVYVSAVANPDHFWIQFITSMSMKLDELVQNMTMCYSSKSYQSEYEEHVAIGDLVAAPFENDSSWYRAQVMDIEGEKLDILYLDYGDSGYIKRSDIRSLRSEFLQLPFQAVECCLADIHPAGDTWTDKTVDVLEELTYSAKWTVLMAKKVGERSGRPSLELIDTNSSVDVNIAHELVRQGLAIWDETDT